MNARSMHRYHILLLYTPITHTHTQPSFNVNIHGARFACSAMAMPTQKKKQKKKIELKRKHCMYASVQTKFYYFLSVCVIQSSSKYAQNNNAHIYTSCSLLLYFPLGLYNFLFLFFCHIHFQLIE